MLTVAADLGLVARRLLAGELLSPCCGAVLAPWGWAQERRVRGADGVTRAFAPRRARCRACKATHVLLPVGVLAGRFDDVEVIGSALEQAALGVGARPIARRLDRPWETVRGWLRAFGRRAGRVREFFTRLVVDVGVDVAMPAGSGSGVGDAVSAVIAVYRASVGRWPELGEVSVWEAACAASGGRLLAPAWP